MDFQTILFLFGAILFLVGLIGHIKAKEIEVGSTSKWVRALSFIIGIFFIIISFAYPFMQDTDEEPVKNPTENTTSTFPQEEEPVTVSDPDSRPTATAHATYNYWEKCQENDDYYIGRILEQEAIINNLQITNRVRGEANIAKARLIREYMRSEKDISIENVDPDLAELFEQLRGLFAQRANYFERIGDVLLSVGDNPDNATVASANQRIDAVIADDNLLQLKLDQLEIERESLKSRLSAKYGRRFNDRER